MRHSMLWAASVRHLLRHRAQLALALIGLTLGVATITAVDLAAASATRAFELSSQATSGGATHELSGGPGGIDEQLFVRLSARHPQLALAPLVTGYVSVRGESLQLIGMDPLAAAAFGGEVSDGTASLGASVTGASRDAPQATLARWLLTPGAAVLAASTARRLGLHSGDAFEIDVSGRRHPAVLIATTSTAGADALLVSDVAQAQEWLDFLGRLSQIEIRAGEGVALQPLERELPPDVHLEPTAARSRTRLEMTQAFTTNLRAMSLLALLVGVFLIYSAVSFAVLQRRRTLAVLRALGATRAELLRLVLAEAAVLGIAGALLGIGLGIVLGRGLVQLVSGTINDLYFVLEVSHVALAPSTLVKAFAAGVLAALVAAALPALEVTRVAPQLGLRRSTLEHQAQRGARRLLVASAALALAAALVVALSSRSLLAGFAGLFLLLLSVAALTPAWLAVCARRAARLAARASPIAALGFHDVGASLSRTGVAIAALGMALAAMLGVSVMVASFRESLRDWLYLTMRADIYISAPGPGFGRPERRLDPQVLGAILALPGLSDYSAGRGVVVDSAAGPIALNAVTLPAHVAAGVQIVAPRETTSVWPAFARGAVLVAEPLAWRLQLHPGERLTLPTPHGAVAFRIAAVFREYGNDRGGVMMERSVYRHWWQDDAVGSLGLYLAPGVSAEQMIPRVFAAAAGRQALYVGSSAELRALSLEIFERTFLITRVLNWLTAGVAAIGLVSALCAWQLEHAHELAMWRALGLTPRAAAVLIEAQTGFMGLVALSAAIPAGLATAWVLVAVINRRAFGWQLDFHLHASQLIDALALAVLAALVAGLYPAWDGMRSRVASALREE